MGYFDDARTVAGICTDMNVEESYQLLGLTVGATIEEVKQSYRLLARKYHPDVNPGDSRSHDRFIQINQAYKLLIGLAKSATEASDERRSASPSSSETVVQTKVRSRKSESVQTPGLTDADKLLKQKSYLELQGYLKHKRFARSVVL